jgi:rod shape determining protein RodA
VIPHTPLEIYLSLFKTTTRERWDWLTPASLAVLSLIGVCFIYSAQYAVPQGSLFSEFWFKQVLFLGLGACLYVGVSLVDYRRWLGIAQFFYIACLVPLVLVFVPGISGGAAERWGASRWIQIPLLGSFQPSESAKIGVLLITASVLVHSRVGSIRQSLGVLGKLALAVGIPLFLILKQPDLKSAIVLPPMVFAMLYVSKLSTRFFAGALAAFLLVVGLVSWDLTRYVNYMEINGLKVSKENQGRYEPHSFLPYVHDYQRNRVLTFLNPEKYDKTGIGWNQEQSLISVGSGGLMGKGWTQGAQAQLGYLPRAVAHNDFIFSVIAEEKGFLGSLTVLSLFGLVLFNGIRIAGLARDRLGTLLAIGVTVLFAVHVFVNIAMTIGLVPITGIPLPFISYGGSFVLSCCLLQGLVQSVYRFRKDFS